MLCLGIFSKHSPSNGSVIFRRFFLTFLIIKYTIFNHYNIIRWCLFYLVYTHNRTETCIQGDDAVYFGTAPLVVRREGSKLIDATLVAV